MAEIIINDDLLDMIEGMTEKLETTTDLSEKIKLHATIQDLTNKIKDTIDELVKEIDTPNIMADPSTVNVDELAKDFNIMDEISKLESDLETDIDTNDLALAVKVYTRILAKSQIIKKAADKGDLVIRKCN